MENFVFNNPTKIIFGKNQEINVGNEVLHHSNKILLHYGGGSIKSSGLYDVVVASLRNSKIEFIELGGVKPNPRLSLVHEGVRLCKENNLGFILAVGGGSVIDSAKAIAIGAHYEGDVWDFYTGKANVTKALPIGTILTIPAAGSESSTGSVITKEEGQLKRAVNSDYIYPKFSILNPERAFTLPKYQVACGATDILAHLMERYFTKVKHVEFTDRLIESTMKTILENVPKVMSEATNYDAWSEIMWAGAIAHNNLLNTGRVGDWASHDIEHEISGIYDVAHGAGLAVVFPAWMKFVYKQDIHRFAQFAVRVFNVEMNYFDVEETAYKGICALENFLVSIEMPIRLTQLGVDGDRIVEMAQKGTDNNQHTVGNFVPLNQANIEEILNIAQSK